MNKEKGPLEEMKQSVVVAAAAAVVEAMTPTQMRKVSEEVIEKVLAGISTDRYSELGRMMESRAEEVLKEHLETDDVKARLRVAVRQGVDAALTELPEQVKGKVIDVATKGMCDALFAKQRRY